VCTAFCGSMKKAVRHQIKALRFLHLSAYRLPLRTKAILFDLDGTLIDSPKFWEQAYHDTFGPRGIAFTAAQFREFYPKGVPLREWLEWLGVDSSLEKEIRAERDRRYEQYLRSQIEWVSGAKDILASLRGKLPIGIVTGSHRSYVHAIDERLPLSSSVDVLLTDDDFDNKAHGLRMCIEKFGTAPEQCLYIGDMPFDRDAATVVGMDFILVPHDYTPHALQSTVKTVSDLRTALGTVP